MSCSEKLTINQVTSLLRESTVCLRYCWTLSGKFSIRKDVNSVLLIVNFHVIVANFIDGAALAVLPDDLAEFSHLLPQSWLRIKLEAAIEKHGTTALSSFP